VTHASVSDQLPPTRHVIATSLGSAVRAVVAHHGVRVAAALWVVGSVVVLWLARGSLPFDRPALAQLPFSLQLAMPTMGMIEVFVLMIVTFLLTSTRAIPDTAARARRSVVPRCARRSASWVMRSSAK
jgi:hypothetical protein